MEFSLVTIAILIILGFFLGKIMSVVIRVLFVVALIVLILVFVYDITLWQAIGFLKNLLLFAF